MASQWRKLPPIKTYGEFREIVMTMWLAGFTVVEAAEVICDSERMPRDGGVMSGISRVYLTLTEKERRSTLHLDHRIRPGDAT